jgi:hypothetical protein
MKIPEIRDELHIIATQVGGAIGDRLRFLADETKRRPYKYNVPRRPTIKLTPARRKWVRGMRTNLRLTYPEIVQRYYDEFGEITNIGRVSECIRGKRT